tara:strand:+ start:242 stop:481 length:240 start_codon:yes stop_codon:yes gene_type:complete
MKKVYVDTSDFGEVTREKLNDNITVGYAKDGEIVGIEITNPVGLDIDDELVVDYTTQEYEDFEFNPNNPNETNEIWGIA